jgi:hypothetical protein
MECIDAGGGPRYRYRTERWAMSATDEEILTPDLTYGYNRTDMWHQLYFKDERGIQNGTGCAWPINYDHEDLIESIKNKPETHRGDYEVRHRVTDGEYEFDLVYNWCGYEVQEPLQYFGLDEAIVYVDYDGAFGDRELYVSAIFHYPSFTSNDEGATGILHLDVNVTQKDANENVLYEKTHQFRLFGDGKSEEVQ